MPKKNIQGNYIQRWHVIREVPISIDPPKWIYTPKKLTWIPKMTEYLKGDTFSTIILGIYVRFFFWGRVTKCNPNFTIFIDPPKWIKMDLTRWFTPLVSFGRFIGINGMNLFSRSSAPLSLSHNLRYPTWWHIGVDKTKGQPTWFSRGIKVGYNLSILIFVSLVSFLEAIQEAKDTRATPPSVKLYHESRQIAVLKPGPGTCFF